ncbi:hypothetical protein BDP27DRAFT_1149477, partial [Rhodocollybia butyracea]
VLTYDIACQYCKYLHQRFKEPPFKELDIGDIVDMIVLLVPKLHLEGHMSDCKYKFSLNYTCGCARVDGEGIERAWPEAKRMGGSTKEMNHGHRHEVLTSWFNKWNFSKMLSMRKSLGRY